MSHNKKSKPALNAEDLEGQDSPPPFLEAPLYPPETLLAYEYLEQGSHLWRWELATVEQQVCVRSIDVDMWLRREADGSHHTATDNVIQPRSARPAEDFSEDLFEGTLTRTHALLPLTSPKTEEGQRIKAQLDHKESRIQESMEEVRANVAQLREDKAAMERELAKIEEDRRKAQDELGEAQKGVEMIKAQHLVEIAGYRAPPSAVKLIMGAVMVVLGERSTQWADVVAVIRSSDFLSRVSTFDPSRITESQIRELKSTKYLKNPRFTREDAVKASYVLGNLYQWVMTQLEMVDVATRATDFEQLKKEREARMEENRQHLAQEKANFTQLEEEMKQLATEYQKAERKDKAAAAAAQFDEAYRTPTKSRSRAVSFTTPANQTTTEEEAASLTGGEDLRKVWYRPEAMDQARYGTILVSSVLCDLGPSPAVGSTLILEPWQQQRIEEAIRSRAAEQQSVTPGRQSRSGSISARKSGPRTVTQHYKHFEGEEWDMVLEDSPAELKQAITNDVADIIELPNRAIKDVSCEVGSLRVTLTVEHDSAITKEEVQASIEDGAYPEVEELYANRHTRRAEIEAAAAEKGQDEKQMEDLREANRQAREAEQQALHDAMQARQAMDRQKREIAQQLAVAQTSSQMEVLEEMQEQLAFSEAFHDQSGLQRVLEEKDKQLENAERELAKSQARLKDQEMRVERAQLMLKEKDTALQQALENLQTCSSSPPSESKGSSSKPVTKVTTHHTAQLEGEEWAMVLEDSSEELHRCFTSDVANACGVPNKAVTALQLSVGSLHAQFSVEHDDTVSEAAVQQQIDEADYSGVLDLYHRRHDRRQQLQVQAELQSALERVRQEKQQVEEEKRLREAEMQKARQEAEELREQTKAMQQSKQADQAAELEKLRRQLQEKEEEKKALLEQQRQNVEKMQALQEEVEEKEKTLSSAHSKSVVAEAATSNEVEKVWKTANKQLEGQREAHMAERRRLEHEKKELAKEKKALEDEIASLKQGQHSPPPSAVREAEEKAKKELEEERRKLEEERKRLQEEEAKLKEEQSLSRDSRKKPTKVTTHHTAQLEGEEWAMVLEDSPEELHRCFTSDVANACGVPNKAVTALQLSVGSLHAQFSVEHDDTVSEAVVQQQIDEADYSGVLDLYQRRHDRRQQLQKEADGKQKQQDEAEKEKQRLQEELEQQRKEKEAMQKQLAEKEKQMKEALQQAQKQHEAQLQQEKKEFEKREKSQKKAYESQLGEEKAKRNAEEKQKKEEEKKQAMAQEEVQQARETQAKLTNEANELLAKQKAESEAAREKEKENREALDRQASALVERARTLAESDHPDEKEKEAIVEALRKLVEEREKNEKEAAKREKENEKAIAVMERKLRNADERLRQASTAAGENTDDEKEKRNPLLQELETLKTAIRNAAVERQQHGDLLQSKFGASAGNSRSAALLADLYKEASTKKENTVVLASIVGLCLTAVVSLQYKRYSYLP